MQHLSQPLIAGESDIFERLIETCYRPLVHLVVRAVAAVNPHDRGLITVLFGVNRWSAKCFCPIRSKAFSMLRMKTVAECMANHFVLEHTLVPSAGQSQYPVETTCCFVDRLHIAGLYFSDRSDRKAYRGLVADFQDQRRLDCAGFR